MILVVHSTAAYEYWYLVSNNIVAPCHLIWMSSVVSLLWVYKFLQSTFCVFCCNICIWMLSVVSLLHLCEFMKCTLACFDGVSNVFRSCVHVRDKGSNSVMGLLFCPHRCMLPISVRTPQSYSFLTKLLLPKIAVAQLVQVAARV